MVMYLRFAVNSHVHNQRYRITPWSPLRTLVQSFTSVKVSWPLSDMLADQCTTLVIALDWSSPCLK